MFERALRGIRVLSLEQAVALPFATRHLADLGADVIRVQSHRRPAPGSEPDLTRNKRQLAIDLSARGGPELFLRVAARCDVVAHNFTPRVTRRFGIDFEGVRAVHPEVIYVSVTGFGTTGIWAERPLWGPGAEAVSGHNLLIGPPHAQTPGRPGTKVFADNTCGLYALFGTLAALDERERTGRGQHVDVSLYESMVSHLGPVLAERAFGGEEPTRVANRDSRYALQGVFAARGRDRSVALSAHAHELGRVAAALEIEAADEEDVARAIAECEAEPVAERLQTAGVAAAVVSNSSDQASDPHLWARGYFGLLQRELSGHEGEYPHAGPPFGGGARCAMRDARPVGADNRAVLSELAGLSEREIDALHRQGVIGESALAGPRRAPAPETTRIDRGELARVDRSHHGWRDARARSAQ